MTVNEKIKTKYPMLDNILNELNIIKFTSVYSIGGHECNYEELKTQKNNVIEPLGIKDLELLYEKLYDKLIKS